MFRLLRATGVRCLSGRSFGTDTGRDLSWNTTGVNRHGFPWPPDCSEASLDFAEKWTPGPRDVFVSTYPKSGTTWMLHLVYQLASKGDFSFAEFHNVNPFWEAMPDIHVSLDKALEPRVIKTHAPLSLLPQFLHGGARAIYVVRDPRDTLVSFYHHSLLTQHLQFEQTFDDFFRRCLSGQLYYGSWFDHVVDALQYIHHPRVLFLSYEAMIKDLPAVLDTVMSFTQYEVPKDVLEDTIIPRLGFKFMQDHDALFDFTLRYPSRKKDARFFRKGQVGDHKGHLTPAHRETLRQKYIASGLVGRLPYQI
jgi:hypothetical protein